MRTKRIYDFFLDLRWKSLTFVIECYNFLSLPSVTVQFTELHKLKGIGYGIEGYKWLKVSKAKDKFLEQVMQVYL